MKNPDGQIPNLDAALDAYVAGTESLRRLRTSSAAKTVACSAAATAALALAPSADAAIQYGVTNLYVSLGQTPWLDIDENGANDFNLVIASNGNTNSFFVYATSNSLGGAFQIENALVARLDLGDQVHPTNAFSPFADLRRWEHTGDPTNVIGNFDGDAAGGSYMGIRFNRNSANHFGWVRLGITNNADGAPIALTVYDWAWETTPDTAITITAIPEPGSGAGLALLAAGAAGVSAWRRRKQPPAQSS